MTLLSTFYVQLELVDHTFQDYQQHHSKNYQVQLCAESAYTDLVF